MKRREAREKAVQVLFQMTLGQTEMTEALENILGEDHTEVDPFLKQLVQGTYEHLHDIDDMIKGALENWHFERLGNIDKTIMRLALFEYRYVDDIPNKVTLNEAVELSKTFGDDETRKFVNGVLSKIFQNK